MPTSCQAHTWAYSRGVDDPLEGRVDDPLDDGAAVEPNLFSPLAGTEPQTMPNTSAIHTSPLTGGNCTSGKTPRSSSKLRFCPRSTAISCTRIKNGAIADEQSGSDTGLRQVALITQDLDVVRLSQTLRNILCLEPPPAGGERLVLHSPSR